MSVYENKGVEGGHKNARQKSRGTAGALATQRTQAPHSAGSRVAMLA